MNDRETSRTQKETNVSSPLGAVEIQHFPVDDPVQKVYLPGEAGIGFVTGVGEYINDEGTKTLIGEVTYMREGEVRTARGPMANILGTDAELRAAERERNMSFAASALGEVALDAVAQPGSMSEPEQHPEDWALPRSEILASIAEGQEKSEPTLIAGIPEHLRPVGYVQPEAVSRDSRRRVPVAMPPNPHSALGFPSRDNYFKSLSEEPKNRN